MPIANRNSIALNIFQVIIDMRFVSNVALAVGGRHLDDELGDGRQRQISGIDDVDLKDATPVGATDLRSDFYGKFVTAIIGGMKVRSGAGWERIGTRSVLLTVILFWNTRRPRHVHGTRVGRIFNFVDNEPFDFEAT